MFKKPQTSSGRNTEKKEGAGNIEIRISLFTKSLPRENYLTLKNFFHHEGQKLFMYKMLKYHI